MVAEPWWLLYSETSFSPWLIVSQFDGIYHYARKSLGYDRDRFHQQWDAAKEVQLEDYEQI